MSPRAEASARAILETLAARLSSLNLEDQALTGLSVQVFFGAGGGRLRSMIVKPEYRDEMPGLEGYVDSCGPIRRRG